ncbi:imidazole glycerol phosphate synthase subunit HisH [Vibrio splendidus]|uniref:imidazole glycerol phosphate synthase subunit HisH n=1 Tax=Vibrio splendidus TaxID=29497 RepID=UPI000380492C|nr:imidazole glycerol phosphate synthase subunit HisH [Vibrio splendidus]OED85729.1 imidazole glycerol phosphate synthase, glutamine amidotransferase subunit [Vibrio splendidus ZF-90]OEF18765.1 imidazole glycerol phosphate synthase, glutamine amidotransferase subunit [Vibrio splendidus 5S-101]PTP34892.1 imidazole glycerol phosphate synthase subunit HisH [Vibrio splendidus]
MLKIIDLKVGNIGSVLKAIKHLGYDYDLISEPSELVGATKIIMPGVGSFDVASQRIHDSGFAKELNKFVLEQKVPFLGICVGMQLLANFGHEGSKSKGLGYIDADVKRIDDNNERLIIPHMGWNNIDSLEPLIFKGISENSCFYFVHSFAMFINDQRDINISYTDYGNKIVAYVNKNNIHGAQFHPEKSQESGLKFIRNFVELC